ncbi:MAG TPA: hypothetical protein VFQ65_16655 [Kofleriaceae bacterium]|nr:hypothetical protein [Kofleriaceae bacterium]
MARSKVTPDRSMLVRERVIALSKRERSDKTSDDKPGDKPKGEEETAPVPIKKDVKGEDATAPVDPALQAKLSAQVKDSFDDETVVPPLPIPDEETPIETQRNRGETIAMPANLGRPPEMPTSSAPPPLALGNVEDPAHMPGPRDIPGGEPDDRAPAPGRVPPGDSRSLRRSGEFALIYRIGTYVISRSGAVGTRGQWRVVEYPTSSSASHSYAKECSRFVSEGFSDYRD